MTPEQLIAQMAATIATRFVNVDADDCATVAVRIARTILDEVRRTAPPPVSMPYQRPPRTAYRSTDGVFHPAPGSNDYVRHRDTCLPCTAEEP